MNKKIFTLTLYLLPLVMMAQSPFTVKGYGPGLKNGDRIYLMYKVNGKTVPDFTVVANNSFAFKGLITGRESAYVCRNDNPFTADLLHDAMTFYIEPGNIILKSADSLTHANVSGTLTNAELMQINAALMPLTLKSRKLSDDFESLLSEQQKNIDKNCAF